MRVHFIFYLIIKHIWSPVIYTSLQTIVMYEK